MARKECPQALATLAALMADENVEPSARIRAADAILNRGMGRVLAMEAVGPSDEAWELEEPLTEAQIRELQRIVTEGQP